MENNNFIAVRSLRLLKDISYNKALPTLAKVIPEMDEEGKTYPVFIFRQNDTVIECYNRFIEANGEDDRNNDNPQLWSGYDEEGIKNQRTCMRLNTRNYRVMNQAFKSGQMGNLIHVYKDDSSNTYVFRFAHNDVLEAIKCEEDKNSQEAWKAKQAKKVQGYGS